MKQNKRKKIVKIIKIVLLILLFISIGIIITDFIYAKKEEKPIFAVHTSTLRDGGTKTYIGMGYTIRDYNQLSLSDGEKILKEGRTETVFKFWFLPFEF